MKNDFMKNTTIMNIWEGDVRSDVIVHEDRSIIELTRPVNEDKYKFLHIYVSSHMEKKKSMILQFHIVLNIQMLSKNCSIHP